MEAVTRVFLSSSLTTVVLFILISGTFGAESSLPRCRPISRIPGNVGVNYVFPNDTAHGVGSYCAFECSQGLLLVGSLRSNCVYDARLRVSYYVESPPKCKPPSRAKCPIMTPVKGGSVRCSDRNRIGSECIHKCPAGYQLVQGGATAASTCQVVDGTVRWSSRSPGECVEVQKAHDEATGSCPPIYSSGAISHFTCTSGRALGSKCAFHCMVGYGILGSRIVSCVTTKNGPRWTGNTPRCQLKTCPALPSKVEHGKFVCTRGNRLKSQCFYRCDDGYHVNGIPQVTCFSGRSDSYMGVWSHNDIPRCTKCRTDEFYCSASDRCIDAMKLCDGTLDCADGEDEKMCLDGERMACGSLHNGNSGFLRSPTLTNGLYSHCTYCNWTIEVPVGYKIKMHFLAFDIEYSGPECEFDGVAIGDIADGQEAVNAFDWSSTSLVKQRFCGRRQFLSPVVSDTNRVGIVFYSNYNKEGRGFSLLWSKIKSRTS